MADKYLVYVWVGLGSALGGMGRFWISGLVADRFGQAFPWGTLIVNVSGSFVIGVLAALARPEGRILISPGAQQFLMYGVLGGYTTFSSFSLQTLNLAREGEWFGAGANAVLSLVCCLMAVWCGHVVGELMNR